MATGDRTNTRVGLDADGARVRDAMVGRPDTPLADAREILDAGAHRRLVVLDPDGVTLRGLLCLTSDRTGLCRS